MITMTLYKKLVRDKIPEIVLRDGRAVKIRTADTQEFDRFLKQKFMEETEKFFESFEKDELADMLQLVHACAEFHGWSMDDLEDLRKKKLDEKGGFSRRIILESIESQV